MPLRRVNWAQAWSEALLIFLGVAAALMGQAWWEGLQEREREAQHLANLASELRVTEANLDTLLVRREGNIARAVRLLEILGDPTVPARGDSIRDHAGWLGYIDGYSPSRAALDGIIAAGDLSLVRDGELRLAISRYREILEANDGSEEDRTTLFDQELLPFYLSDRFSTLDSGPREMEAETLPRSRFAIDYEALSRSLEFENLVAMYIWLERDAFLVNQSLREETRAVLRLIEGAGGG